MFEFLQYPKLIRQYAETQDRSLREKCIELLNEYQIINPQINQSLQLDLDYNTEELANVEHHIDQLLLENKPITLEHLKQVIPKYVIGLEFKRASYLLAKIIMDHSGDIHYEFELHTWIYIINLFQVWFDDSPGDENSNKDIPERPVSQGNVHKSLLNTYRKLELLINKYQFQSDYHQKLINLVQLLNILHYFKMARFGEIDYGKFSRLVALDETSVLFNDLKYFYTDVTVIYIIHLVLTLPFNKVKLSPPVVNHLHSDGQSELVALIDHLKASKYYDFSYEKLAPYEFYYPESADEKSGFLDWFKLTVKFKLFLNLMTFTSKISKHQLKTLINITEEDINKIIVLISALELTTIGVGYDINTSMFYNSGTETVVNDTHANVNKLSNMLEGEVTALTLKKYLVENI